MIAENINCLNFSHMMKFLQFLGQTFRQNYQSLAYITHISVYFAKWKLKIAGENDHCNLFGRKLVLGGN